MAPQSQLPAAGRLTMPYRMKPHVELLIVKDQNGVLWHHYQNPSAATGARNLGPIIAWIGPEYLDRWLRLGLVEEISDESAAAQNRSTSAQFGGAPEPIASSSASASPRWTASTCRPMPAHRPAGKPCATGGCPSVTTA